MPETCNIHNVQGCNICQKQLEIISKIDREDLAVILDKAKTLDQILLHACSNGKLEEEAIFDIDLHCAQVEIRAKQYFSKRGFREGYKIISIKFNNG